MNLVIPSGIISIDKPSGITSNDVLNILRKIFKNTKIGHTGTLDPMATGVMNVCIGNATKLSNYLMGDSKKYSVKMLLGVDTDTYDITGKILKASPVSVDEVYIRERIKRFIGKIEQVPPMYSAIKVNGKKLYEYARNNETIEVKSRIIEIYDITNIVIEDKVVSFDVFCSKGTYIRSLVHDIGEKIGCFATMIELRRTKCGNSDIKDAIKIDDFLKLSPENMIKAITTIETYFKDSKAIYLNDIEYNKILNGIKLDYDYSNNIVRLYNNNVFKGLGIIEDNKLRRYVME